MTIEIRIIIPYPHHLQFIPQMPKQPFKSTVGDPHRDVVEQEDEDMDVGARDDGFEDRGVDVEEVKMSDMCAMVAEGGLFWVALPQYYLAPPVACEQTVHVGHKKTIKKKRWLIMYYLQSTSVWAWTGY